MFAFLLTALATFAVIWLAGPVVRVLGAWTEAPVSWGRFSARRAVALVVRGGLVLAIVAVLAVGLWDWELFTSARNFRVLVGFVFGCLLWLFVRALAAPPSARPKEEGGGLGEAGAASGGGRAGRGGGARALMQPPVVLAAALVGVWLWALLAPHGELDLAGVRAVKTPFIEAQFARNESDLRMDLQLESEAAGFLTLGPAGLAHALYTARHEVLFHRARVAAGESGAVAAEAGAAAAFDLVANGLQPVARCVHALKRRYRDREAVTALVHGVAAGWGGAIVRAWELERAKAGADAFVAVERRLVRTLEDFERAARDALWDDGLDEEPLAERLCAVDFAAALAPARRPFRFDGAGGDEVGARPSSWAGVILHPAVVTATATFHLWAGDPDAALALFDKAAKGDGAFPGFAYLRGFAERWQSADRLAPQTYLEDWAFDIELLEERARRLRDRTEANACDRSGRSLAVLAYDGLVTVPEVDALDACDLQDAAGYYAFRAQKVRMHLVYESARHLLTGRRFPDRDAVLRRARAHGRVLQRFVAADALHAEDAYMLQVVEIEGLGWRPAVTSSSAPHDYAFALDAYGAALLAEAFDDGDADPAETEPAIVAFEDALAYAAEAGVGWHFTSEMRDRLEQARRAIGLVER